MNFFDHKNLGNHLLQLCPKAVKHPVYIARMIHGPYNVKLTKAPSESQERKSKLFRYWDVRDFHSGQSFWVGGCVVGLVVAGVLKDRVVVPSCSRVDDIEQT